MASKPEASAKLPWYKRWISRSPEQVGRKQNDAKSSAVAAPSTPHPTYYCEVCGYAAKIRGDVYDHIKSSHKEVLDRHGHIREQPHSPQSSAH